MNYLQFVRSEWRFLAFGLFFTCLSGFGQTFFIAIFGPEIRATFSLSHGGFGTLYSVATCCSALSLVWVGKWIDHIHLRNYSIGICLGMVLACFLLSISHAPWLLCFALYLLRLSGQGLMGHTSLTSMARYLADHRGKAMGVSSMGHQLSEILFPLPGVLLLNAVGWRSSWELFAIGVACIAIPLVLWLLRGHNERHDAYLRKSEAADQSTEEKIEGARSWTRGEVLRDWRFYTLLPAIVATPFIATGVFFHQAVLVAEKGWTLLWFASTFSAFALSGLLSALVGGVLIDRFRALDALPYFLLPLTAGLLTLSFTNQPAAALALMVGAGLSNGTAVILLGALWPELYGTKHLGAIRAVLASLMVLSTALSPPLMGVLIDRGVSFDLLTLSLVGYIALSTLLLQVGRRSYR